MQNSFYFFNERYATRFHIARRLAAKGWTRAVCPEQADFSDQNLILNDEISQHLEYKHLLWQLCERYCPQVMPLSYCVNDDNYQAVLAKIMYTHYLYPPRSDPHAVKAPPLKWILKPALLNNGDDIKLFEDIDALRLYYDNPRRLGGEHVIQQYITNPALIGGRKYTFRISALLTNFAGVLLNKHGYINISALPFDLSQGLSNRKMHITNYVLDGEFAHIEQRATQEVPEFAEIYRQMVTIVKKILEAILTLAPAYLQRQKIKKMEIFGFDFMLDQEKKLWLLEINQSPDAPTFEENSLEAVLWTPFWQNIVDNFVLPIALNTPFPKHPPESMLEILTANDCDNARLRLRAFLKKVKILKV